MCWVEKQEVISGLTSRQEAMKLGTNAGTRVELNFSNWEDKSLGLSLQWQTWRVKSD
jgi:hypothetical protein